MKRTEHRRRKSPSAKLIQWTRNPIHLVYNLFQHNKEGDPLEKPRQAEDYEVEFIKKLLMEDWCGLLEFPNFSWQMVLPRSFHAQVRTHRHWSYFSESHQVLNPRKFASNKDYFQIPGLNQKQRIAESSAMFRLQTCYQQFLDTGVVHSLARGLLPMHINLALAVSTNLRSLFQTAVWRRCHVLQGTYWNDLLDQMKEEIVKKVDSRLGFIFDLQPCDIRGNCPAEIEQLPRLKGFDAHEVCPRYKQLLKTENKSSCCGEGCQGCLKFAREKGLKVERSIDK